jgi:hypothetical protein
MRTPGTLRCTPRWDDMIAMAAAIVGILIAGILISMEVGHRIGVRRARNPGRRHPLSASIQGAIFGLMALLVSFTFYGAGSRFDARRSLAVREANAIGTTYLRLDLLPPETQPELREDFRVYLRSRLAVFQQIPNIKAVKAALDRSSALQDSLWTKVVKASNGIGPAERILILSSLNDTIDITTESTVAFITHPPAAVFIMLALTVIFSSGLAGYEMSGSSRRDWVSTISFTLVLAIALYVILDYEFPRIGLIRVDPVDQVLVHTLNKMK